MRDRKDHNGVAAKAYAGPSGIMLAMNVADNRRDGLLGFAVRKATINEAGEETWSTWLDNKLGFPGMQHKAGEFISTEKAPLQRFRWSDFRVYADTLYQYTVHPAYGDPANPQLEDGPTIRVKTASKQGVHTILFNRAAAASQAFSAKFPDEEARLDAELKAAKRENRPANLTLSKEAYAWLSKGLLEKILSFIALATDANWALSMVIYEYELADIVQAINAAHTRGVNVRIVYHAKARDEQTSINAANLTAIPDNQKRGRLTSSICHDKFIVLSHLENGQFVPKAVLCGSTNFTENGVYRQANVVHVLDRADIAQQYQAIFETLFGGASQAKMRTFIDRNNAFNSDGELFAGFSPRGQTVDLDGFVTLIGGAHRDVLFATAFDMDDKIDDALLGVANDSILRYGIKNTLGKRIRAFNADRTAGFIEPALIPTGFEGYLKESYLKQKGTIHIHTKIIIVDFTSDEPLVVSGSHNFSGNASRNNDENYLILRGNTDVADAYGCEVMRFYDHYRFRYKARKNKQETGKQLELKPDNTWTKPYFEPETADDVLRWLDRGRFCDPPK